MAVWVLLNVVADTTRRREIQRLWAKTAACGASVCACCGAKLAFAPAKLFAPTHRQPPHVFVAPAEMSVSQPRGVCAHRSPASRWPAASVALCGRSCRPQHEGGPTRSFNFICPPSTRRQPCRRDHRTITRHANPPPPPNPPAGGPVVSAPRHAQYKPQRATTPATAACGTAICTPGAAGLHPLYLATGGAQTFVLCKTPQPPTPHAQGSF